MGGRYDEFFLECFGMSCVLPRDASVLMHFQEEDYKEGRLRRAYSYYYEWFATPP